VQDGLERDYLMVIPGGEAKPAKTFFVSLSVFLFYPHRLCTCGAGCMDKIKKPRIREAF
jgi:hypothetical protein